MGNLKLLEKSEENERAAELLSDNEMYNAATSRAYYSMYQKVIYILNKNKIEHPKSGMGCHDKTIQIFADSLLSADKRGRVNYLKLGYIKKLRTRCDYWHDVSFDDQFYKKIKPKIVKINEVLSEYTE